MPGPIKTPQQAVDRWIAGMKSGTARQKYIDGINAYTGNPMAAASTPAALAKYVNNTAAAAAPGGKFVRGLAAADPGYWKSQATGGGASRLGSGADKGKVKFTNAVNKLAPAWASMRAAAASAGQKGDPSSAKARFGAALDALGAAVGKHF